MEKREKILLWAIVGVGFAVRLYFLLRFENIFSWEVEDYSKLNLVTAWIQHGKPYPDTNFGPLHTWLIYLLTLPFADPVWPVRIFSLLCGTLTLPIFYFIARRETTKAAAVISTALFAFYPVHVRASATSLAEAPYALAFLGGLLAFLIHQRDKEARYGWMVLSAACFTAAGMFRFEAWLFFPVLCLVAIRRGLLKAVGYGAMLAAFPAWHMYLCWKSTGNPFSFGQTSAASFMLYLPQMPLSYRATAWPVAFWEAMSGPLAVIAVLGLIRAAYAKKGGFLFSFFIVPYLFLSYRTIDGKIDPALLRYSVVLASLLIPFAGMFLEFAFGLVHTKPRAGRAATAVTTALLCSFLFSWSYLQAKDNLLPSDVKALAVFLRNETNPDDRIVLDKRFHPYLVVESRHNPDLLANLLYKPGSITDRVEYDRLARMFFPLSYGHGEETDWGRDIKLYDAEESAKILDAFDPTVLVLDYESGGNIQAFPIPPDAESARIGERVFTRVFRRGDYAVFRITHAEAAP